MKNCRDTKIKEALEQLKDLNNIYSEDFEEDDFFCDEDSGSFLTKKEEKIIETLCRLPSHRWDSSKLCKGYIILEEHKERLGEINIIFDNIEKPDFHKYELSKSCDLIKIGNNNSILIKKCIFKDFDKILNEDEEYIEFSMTLNNIVKLWKLQEDKKILLNKKILYIINIYINNVNHDEESCALSFDNYNKIPMPFQNTGILFGLLNKKVLIADEMGLGKTIQAIGILIKSSSFPAIVVCPKSLKYKWASECSFIEGKTFEVVDNKTDFNNLDKDIYIVNYENVKKYIDIIDSKKEIKAIVFDESHYLKNAKTKRSKSCMQLTQNKNYIIELSGSPVLNRPQELINQIEVIDRLEEFGGYQNFVDKYCINEKEIRMQKYRNQKNYTDNTIEEKELPNYEELAEKLRSSFYIRREKKEILKDLPPKFRTIIPVEINNKSEYKCLLKDYKKESDLKIKKNLLEKLKQTACKGKFDSIKERINSHIENKEKVIVFAYHKKMQEDLLKEFPNSLRIISEQDEYERNRNAERFQEEDDQYVIICSISVAYYGFDLYKASQVLFAEMDWVPLINIQSEDRAHRIGQKDSVNVWYMIAKDTIEEQIVKVNKEKMETIEKINKNISINQINVKDIIMKMLED